MLPTVLVLADNPASGQQLIEKVLRPAGLSARLDDGRASPAELLVVDISRLRGAPLAALDDRRKAGDHSPAIVLAAHLTTDLAGQMFRLNVRRFLLKPVDAAALRDALIEVQAEQAARKPPVRGEETTGAEARLQQAEQQLKQRVEEMRTITTIGRAVAEECELDTVLTHVVEAAAYLTGAEEGALYLLDPATQELVLRAARDPGQVYAAGMRLQVSDTLAGQVLRTGQPVIHNGSEAGIKVKTGYLVSALINVPLRVRSNPVGVLGVYHRTAGRRFEDGDVEALLALADWAGVAVENARRVAALEEQLGAARQEIERLQASAEHPVADLIPPTLRTGLSDIIAESQALLAAAFGPLESAQAESLTRIRDRGARLHEELSRLTGHGNGAQAARPARARARQAFDLRDLIGATAAELTPEARARGLNLRVDDSGQFPQVFAPLEQVQQMLRGLLLFALNRTTPGEVDLTAYRLRVRGGVAETPFPLPAGVQLSSGAWLIISLSDGGESLTPEARAALLVSELAGATARGGPLSLAGVRRMAESLGGRLWVEAGQPDGLILSLALPGK